MKFLKTKIALIIAAIIAIGIFYYVTLPALNLHSTGVWVWMIVILVAITFFLYPKKSITIGNRGKVEIGKGTKITKWMVRLIVLVAVVFIGGSVLSSTIINADKYQKLLPVKDGEFSKDIEQLSFDQIPLLDKDSANLLGNRKMGSIVDMVSQFEVDDIYSQINYKGRPVRISPLKYASPIKWFTNRAEGIPAYIKIDMATQNTELVRLKDKMKYSTSEYFGRNIYRHLRFAHPTYIYDRLSFEVDEEGIPYWIAPVKKFNVGLFGGVTVGRVVLANAITGETKDYDIKDVPKWVDRVHSANLLIELFDYHGALKHGWFNSVFGQRDSLKTTSGYNYLAINDDVWVYTGVTSVSGDESNVGFVLMNQRTMQTKFYKIDGATESSAMSSAEGQVQNLKYKATFPLLLNMSNEPTYFLALKDAAGLVKKYAMVNVKKYQLVAIGDTVSQCEEQYNKLLLNNGVTKIKKDERDVLKMTGKIRKIVPNVVGGNTHFVILLKDKDEIFDVSLDKYLEIVKFDLGDMVEVSYKKGDKVNNIVSVKHIPAIEEKNKEGN